MMKTLRVTLADLEGIPHGSAPGSTSAEVTAAYTGVVALTDGTLIPNAIKGKNVGGTGIVNFTVYPSDSPDVREEYHGFGVTITAKIQSFDGTVVTARRTVIVPDSSPSTVHLGNLAPADPLPPQWVTVGEFVGYLEAAVEAAENAEGQEGPPGPAGPAGPKGDAGDPGTTEWAGITDKPSTFPPTEHGHAMGDVTGLVDQISGVAYEGDTPFDFGPGTGLPVAVVAAEAYGMVDALAGSIYDLEASRPGVVTVVTGNEERPIAHVVFWIGGTTQPANMTPGDVWMEVA